MKIWHINNDLLKEEGMLNYIQTIWQTQLKDSHKGGIAKLLRAMDETRIYLRSFGKERAHKQREEEEGLLT